MKTPQRKLPPPRPAISNCLITSRHSRSMRSHDSLLSNIQRKQQKARDLRCLVPSKCGDTTFSSTESASTPPSLFNKNLTFPHPTLIPDICKAPSHLYLASLITSAGLGSGSPFCRNDWLLFVTVSKVIVKASTNCSSSCGWI